jgi:hypothetical protein
MHQVWRIAIYAAVWLLVFLPGPDALIIVWLAFLGCCAVQRAHALCERWRYLWNAGAGRGIAREQAVDGVTAGP